MGIGSGGILPQKTETALLSSELWYLLQIANIESDTAGLALAVSSYKIVQPILSSPNYCDLDASLNQTISHRLSNAGRASDQHDMLVGESHDC
jgi:hypothetical protein